MATRHRPAHRRDGVGGPEAARHPRPRAPFDNAITTVLGARRLDQRRSCTWSRWRGRAGVAADLDRFDALARRTPCSPTSGPSGKYLMEDFYYAGGLRALLARARRPARRCGERTVNGTTLGENIAGARGLQRRRDPAARQPARRRTTASPCCAATSRRDGAVIKPAAAEPHLLQHTGPAVVFADYNDMAARIDDPALAGRPPTRCSCCSNAGPAGRARACPSGASCRSRRSCSQQGVRDMVRISDARMSGTSYGACVLHVAPESFVGGPLALVRDGDLIELDVAGRAGSSSRSTTTSSRAAAPRGRRPPPRYERGYGALYHAAHHAGRRGLRLRLPRGTARRRPSRRSTSERQARLETDRPATGPDAAAGGTGPRRELHPSPPGQGARRGALPRRARHRRQHRRLLGHGGVNAALLDAVPNAARSSPTSASATTTSTRARARRGVIVTNTPDVLTERRRHRLRPAARRRARHLRARTLPARRQWLKGQFRRHARGGKRHGRAGAGPHRQGHRDARRSFGVVILPQPRRARTLPYPLRALTLDMARRCDFLMVAAPGGRRRAHRRPAVLEALGPEGYSREHRPRRDRRRSGPLDALEEGASPRRRSTSSRTSRACPRASRDGPRRAAAARGRAPRGHARRDGPVVLDNLASFFETGRALTPV